jgi:hypothetical protein
MTSASCSGADGAAPSRRPAARRSAARVRWRRWLAGLAAAALGGAAWAALAPIRSDSPDERFVIPRGTWARRMAGEKTEILPDVIHLTLGVKDVLVLRNDDDVPQIFGPTLMMPGQGFRLPFEVASSYPFACTAHVSGQLLVVVEPNPATPWARLGWRLRALLRRVR